MNRLSAWRSSPFVRFLLAGGIAALANILARVVLSLFMGYEIAVVIAYLVGMVTAYVLMRLFIFERSRRSVVSEWIRFSLVNFIALAQVWLVSVGLANWLFPQLGFAWHPDTIAHVIGVLSPVATSYIGHKSFTFAVKSSA